MFFLILFLATISYSSQLIAESELVDFVVAGSNYDYRTDFTGGEKTIGIKRLLNGLEDDDDKWQLYYFCAKAKGANKKNCGSWVDGKGNKIKGEVTLKATLKGKNVVLGPVFVRDAGRYASIFEDSKQQTSVVQVRVRPPAPLHG
ncbi:TransThyretin-Related family domain [Caenorhabditis elegans]|uniref:TransThyretin-Related family domain n=1 Tax=Caenorhabditis elegans TaxID=6239 RepID=O45640_CAEEL|nr:TransThyretin-Related family domain [Caenorhabditis elegans]CAB05239.1 TransThyretin-Related family domain [Caenorhabditis elegans]|eukprot:NP_502944.1 Uncharacterized protein CELE_K03D3.2 [Caenorhabditis elegans]